MASLRLITYTLDTAHLALYIYNTEGYVLYDLQAASKFKSESLYTWVWIRVTIQAMYLSFVLLRDDIYLPTSANHNAHNNNNNKL